MLTYISLVLGTASAIVGAFLKPTKELPNGKKKLRPVAAIFIILPILSFSVAAWQYHSGSNEIEALKESINASVDRVDAFEIQLTYSFPAAAVGVGPDVKAMMKGILGIYSYMTHGPDGQLRYGIAKDMYGGETSEDEAKLLKALDLSLQRITNISPPILFVAKTKGLSGKPLRELVLGHVRMGFVGPTLDTGSLSSSVALYRLPNPRATASFPPPLIAGASEFWLVPKKDADDPEFEVTWRYRLFSHPSAGLRLLRDYDEADFVLFAPSLNPDLDSAPGLGAFGKPFGRVTGTQVLVGGKAFKWEASSADGAENLVSPERPGRPSENVGQLLPLRSPPTT